ncbi:MAG: hypothetical protein JWP01_1209 [Myxococcales bacterium]|nr:hypothetical protein [Myxococcales bacterium]
MLRITASLYPRIDGEFFDEHSSGTAVCWCAETDVAAAVLMISKQLASQGWSLDRVIDLADEASVDEGSEGKQRAKARAAGLALNVGLHQRLWIEGDAEDKVVWEGDVGIALAEPFQEFCAALTKNDGAFALHSAEDDQYAEAELLEQDVFPLWKSEEEARIWLPDWPSYVPTHMSLKTDLIRKLVAVDTNDELLAVGLHGSLYTFHPMSLLDLVGGDWWTRWRIDRRLDRVIPESIRA